MKDIENSNTFKKVLDKTEHLVEDNKRVTGILEKALKKLGKVKDKGNEFKENLKLSINLIKDWGTGNYKEVPKKTIIYMLAGIVYFLIPIMLFLIFYLNLGF